MPDCQNNHSQFGLRGPVCRCLTLQFSRCFFLVVFLTLLRTYLTGTKWFVSTYSCLILVWFVANADYGLVWHDEARYPNMELDVVIGILRNSSGVWKSLSPHLLSEHARSKLVLALTITIIICILDYHSAIPADEHGDGQFPSTQADSFCWLEYLHKLGWWIVSYSICAFCLFIVLG